MERLGAKCQPPSVSVIIVAYNSLSYLDTCLAALLAQTYPPVEIILVDNASIDGSAEAVAARYPMVRVIRAEHNLGFAAGNNRGVAAARGELLAFLNPDTEAAPTWLAPLVAAVARDPSVGLATSKILLFDRRDRVNACGNDVHYTGLACCRGLGRPAIAFAQLEDVAAVSGAAFIIRRDLMERLGGFDERFFMYLEDTDLSWRARLAGYRCVGVPESVVCHHFTLRLDPAKLFYLERNRALVLLQNYQVSTLCLLLPALLLSEIVTWGYAILQRRRSMAAKVRAYQWIGSHLGEILAARRRAQRLRRVTDGQVLRSFGYRLAIEQVNASRLMSGFQTLCHPCWAGRPSS